jgi:hypothetical protein
MAAAIISGVSVLVAISAFVVARGAERRSRMPVLVLLPDPSGWCVKNIGNGPAVNVVIAQGRGSGGGSVIELDPRRIGRGGIAPGECWCNPIHLRPLDARGEETMPWPFENSGVGISYTDVLGSVYDVRMSAAGTRVFEIRRWIVLQRAARVPSWGTEEWMEMNELETWAATGEFPKRLVKEPWSPRPRSG